MEARCAMDRRTFTITVNPTGEVDHPASLVVCNGRIQRQLLLQRPAPEVLQPIAGQMIANDRITATNNGDIPSFGHQPGTAPVVATIVDPHASAMEARRAMDRQKTFTITVNPTAEADLPAGEVICNGNTTAVTFTTTSTGGVTTYSWANNQPTIGLPATGNGDIPSFVATNPRYSTSDSRQ